MCLPLFFLLGLFWTSMEVHSAPQRIVSINLCTDQFLIAVARPEQILALSPFARDREMSHFSEVAQRFPLIRDDAESVIKMNPDLVLASVFSKASTLKIIRKQGIKVVTLKYPGSLKEISEQLAFVGAVTGNRDKGLAAQKHFTDVMVQTKGLLKQLDKTALYYQRGGYISGKFSLVGMLLQHTGLKNHAEQYGVSSYGSLSLEQLLFDPPDILLMAKQYKESGDQGHQLLRHPAFKQIIQKKNVLRFPVSETVCPGPSTLNALKRLQKLRW